MAILSLNLKNVKDVVGRRLKPCPNTNVKIILSTQRVRVGGLFRLVFGCVRLGKGIKCVARAKGRKNDF